MLPWKWLAMLLAFCLVNALWRNVNSPSLRDDLGEWLIAVANGAFTGFIVAGLLVISVMLAVNRLPWRGWRLYLALAVVAALASAFGSVLLLAWESDGAFLSEALAVLVALAESPASTLRHLVALFAARHSVRVGARLPQTAA